MSDRERERVSESKRDYLRGDLARGCCAQEDYLRPISNLPFLFYAFLSLIGMLGKEHRSAQSRVKKHR